MNYNKLIRDSIIEIIEKKGEKATYHVANDSEYYTKLKEKLLEETNEFLSDETTEELADILEVINALCEVKGITFEDVEKERKKKNLERGTFSKRIILDSTEH